MFTCLKGFQAIRANGKLDIITESHAHPEVVPYVHDTSLFTYWHGMLNGQDADADSVELFVNKAAFE